MERLNHQQLHFGIVGEVSRSVAVLIINHGEEVFFAEGLGMDWREMCLGCPPLIIGQLLHILSDRIGMAGIQLARNLSAYSVAVSGLNPKFATKGFINAVSHHGLGHNNLRFSSLSEAGHIGAFLGGPGVVIRCGHGSSVWAQGSKGSRLVGGWGNIIGYPGSGQWLGQQALVAATRVLDLQADSEETLYVQKLLGLLQYSNAMSAIEALEKNREYAEIEARRFLTRAGRATVLLAEQKDPYAEKILCGALDKLADAVGTALHVAAPGEKLDLCVRGTLLEKEPYFCARVIHRLLSEFKALRVRSDKRNGMYSPAIGVGLLAMGCESQADIETRGSTYVSRIAGVPCSRPRLEFLPT